MWPTNRTVVNIKRKQILDEIGELGRIWQSCVTNIGDGIGGSVASVLG